MEKIKAGIYLHYKQKKYRVFYEATHSETGECVVVYQCLYGDHSIWVRPKTMFLETVVVDGVKKPRFELIKPDDTQ